MHAVSAAHAVSARPTSAPVDRLAVPVVVARFSTALTATASESTTSAMPYHIGKKPGPGTFGREILPLAALRG